MTTTFLNAAVQHHQAGRLADAERLYKQALARDPRNPDALHLLGLVAHQSGRHSDAIELIGKAIKAKPRIAQYHNSLATVFRGAGRSADAVRCYRHALRISSDAQTFSELGVTLIQMGRADEAIEAMRQAVKLAPQVAEYVYNLGTALSSALQHDEGLACLRTAVALNPRAPDTHSNVALTLVAMGRPAEAVEHYQEAIRLSPGNANYHSNLGITFRSLQRPQEALACFARAVKLQPDHADAHLSAAMVRLSMGDMPAAWDGLEWRWRTLALSGIRPSLPLWRGEAAEGRTLLVLGEQGFGDVLQFARYVPLVAERGMRVVMQVQTPLIRLLQQSFPGVQVGPFAEAEGDMFCPVMSFPAAFGTTLDTIPAKTPYLRADPAQAKAWRTRLAGYDGLRVGLCWAGNPRADAADAAAVDRFRSMSPSLLAGLVRRPGCHFFSLQKTGPAAPADFGLIDFMSEMADFADTAALVSNLDLVITVDTAVAHLAAALGKPVWMMDRFSACWRWMLNRDDTPWYPTTLRIYRQLAPGDWHAVLWRVIQHLDRLVVSSRNCAAAA